MLQIINLIQSTSVQTIWDKHIYKYIFEHGGHCSEHVISIVPTNPSEHPSPGSCSKVSKTSYPKYNEHMAHSISEHI